MSYTAFDLGNSISVYGPDGFVLDIPYDMEITSREGAAFNLRSANTLHRAAIDAAVNEIRAQHDWTRITVNGKKWQRGK